MTILLVEMFGICVKTSKYRLLFEYLVNSIVESTVFHLIDILAYAFSQSKVIFPFCAFR